MTPVEILKAARELISVPERWTQGCEARGDDRRELDPLSDKAVCWCADGALSYAGKEAPEVIVQARIMLENAALALEGADYIYVNDSIGHANILDVFDSAIASAEPPLLSARQEQA